MAEPSEEVIDNDPEISLLAKECEKLYTSICNKSPDWIPFAATYPSQGTERNVHTIVFEGTIEQRNQIMSVLKFWRKLEQSDKVDS